MLAGMVLATLIGQTMMVTPPAGAVAGDTLIVRRLEPTIGAPGRAPFFRWAEVGRLRVVVTLEGGRAEATMVRGSFAPGDRLEID